MTGGRPSALTPEVQNRVLAALRCGLSRAAAAARAGIGARTLRDWMARTDDVEPYASFRVAVEAAEGVCEARLAAVVFKAALADPNQARWLLERRFPSSWGRRSAEPERGSEPAQGSLNKFLRPQTGVGAFLHTQDPADTPFWLKPKADNPTPE